MKNLLFLGMATCAVPVFSQPTSSPITLPPVELIAEGSPALPPQSPSADLSLAEQGQELSKTLRTLPGVSMRAQGCHGGEPVLRGLGWERVGTQVNGLNLHGACPSRMDPPINLFSAGELDSVSVELGPASVTRGPVPIGGRLLLEDRLRLAPENETRRNAELGLGAGTNGDHLAAGIKAETATDRTAVRVQGSIESADDYESGGDTTVPANYESEKASAFWTQRLAADVILELGTRWIYNQDIDFISLPMDSRHEKTNITTGALSWTPEQEHLQEVVFRAGIATVDHLMDNRDKANRRRVEASTPSTADSSTASLQSVWNVPTGTLRAGVDASLLERDATRTRKVLMMNRTFLDPIWPDLDQEQLGAFGEWEQSLQENTRLRAGLRVDEVKQDSGKAGAKIVPGPGVGMTTVEQAWVDVGGSEPGVVENSDTLFSGNIVLEQSLNPDWRVQFGLSRVEAAPNLTQRYLSFGPVPGGFGIGTPSLDPEEKWEVELRTEGSVGTHSVGAAVFAARIHDYLLPTTVAMLDVNGDGRVDRVRGTVNEDAELYGAEASALLRLTPGLSFPVSLSFVRGEVRDTGTPLPEIPPLDIRAALRWEEPEQQRWFAEIGMYFAARQDRVNPEFGEDETPSFTLFHLRGGTALSERWRIEAGIDNLFDREYHEHLTREALLPEGDLKPGDEVPGPGRNVHLAVKAVW